MQKGTTVSQGTLRSWPIDTLPKALDVLAAIELLLQRDGQGTGASAAVQYLINEYPELKQATHQCMADIIRCQRETISRTGILSRQKGS